MSEGVAPSSDASAGSFRTEVPNFSNLSMTSDSLKEVSCARWMMGERKTNHCWINYGLRCKTQRGEERETDEECGLHVWILRVAWNGG